MRILIVGATGNSGLALTRMALARGLRVTAYVRSAEKLQALLGEQGNHPALTISTGTLANEATLARAMAGQDAVINAAGNATVDPDFVALVQSVIATAGSDLRARSLFNHGEVAERSIAAVLKTVEGSRPPGVRIPPPPPVHL